MDGFSRLVTVISILLQRYLLTPHFIPYPLPLPFTINVLITLRNCSLLFSPSFLLSLNLPLNNPFSFIL